MGKNITPALKGTEEERDSACLQPSILRSMKLSPSHRKFLIGICLFILSIQHGEAIKLFEGTKSNPEKAATNEGAALSGLVRKALHANSIMSCCIDHSQVSSQMHNLVVYALVVLFFSLEHHTFFVLLLADQTCYNWITDSSDS